MFVPNRQRQPFGKARTNVRIAASAGTPLVMIEFNLATMPWTFASQEASPIGSPGMSWRRGNLSFP
ncbi:MAG TPA: hypothetical protein VMS32_01595, partial [Verrucomicrobiae bacterium]|nr:hypothetical protein [Verrucomicrobiae bacterium]